MKRTSSAPFIESDHFSPWLKRRFTGWYDAEIVTRKGEDILSDLDNYASKVFIERGHTYRHRRSPFDLNVIDGGYKPNQFYTVENVDSMRLRRFGISLLWRFAVSRLAVATRVSLPPTQRTRLETILRGGPDDWEHFPVYFAVASDGDELVKISPMRMGDHPFIRFFLDGIVCYASPWKRNSAFSDYNFLFAGRHPRKIDLFCFDSNDSAHNRYATDVTEQVIAKHGNPYEKKS